ncbi:MAG: hypothetical protein HFF18_03105 [Oscillospiraceae bacterium]|nr:hypothetical protein [Oscillospiraceae bacterium]
MKKQLTGLTLCVLAILLLGSCREWRERMAENSRIYRLAEQHAETRAVAYIREKYGVEAAALGYDVQGSDVYMGGFYANAGVLVLMEQDGKQFFVYLNLDSESIFFDNFQSEEISAALETAVLERLALPMPEESTIKYSVWESGGWTVAPAIDGKGYSVQNMVNFRYDGQSGEELLNQMDDVFYTGYFCEDLSLDTLDLDPADWPDREDFWLRTGLIQFLDREHYERFLEQYEQMPTLYTMQEHAKYWPFLRGQLSLTLSYRSWDPNYEREYQSYVSASQYGLDFIGVMPFDPETCLAVSEDVPVWHMETKKDICDYEQVSPLLYLSYPEEWETGPVKTHILCTVPEDYFAEHGEPLYVGVYCHYPKQDLVYVYPKALDRTNASFGIARTAYMMDSATAPHEVQYALLRLVSREAIPQPTPGVM